ncbi:hypothetical protein Lal_00006853 [Lupinus albus]|nr:hypothetical protein Lal_00006853 [Lupinus albus]
MELYHISIVSQEPTQFNCSIEENIAYGFDGKQIGRALLIALDAESEYLVQDAMDSLMKGRTVLVIAHRLSTGTDDELLSKDGVYTALVRRQLQTAKAESI